MSIIGKGLKATVAIIANGLDYVITKSTNTIKNKYGENEFIESVSQIGTSSVRATETTVKTLADVVDGGIEAGIGYLSDNKSKQNIGVGKMKTAGKDIVTGVQQGIAFTVAAGAQTTSSAVKAGKYYIKGHKMKANQEFANTKVYAKNFGKVVAVGLLAFGPVELNDREKESPQGTDNESNQRGENVTSKCLLTKDANLIEDGRKKV